MTSEKKPIWRVTYPGGETGLYFDRARCEETLGSFRANGRAWLQESSDNGRTWRTLDV